MTHTERAELILGFITGETKSFNLGNIIKISDALEPHIDDFEKALNIQGFSYHGDTYRDSQSGEKVEGKSDRIMGALYLFAYARESLLAKSE